MQSMHTVAVFLDIQGAFDNVCPDILLQDLSDIGIPARCRKFVENLIFKRKIFFVKEGTLIGPFFSFKGTPQGSTLSPILFNLYLRKIFECIPQGVRILQYADDIVLFATEGNIEKAFECLQTALDSVWQFLQNRGLKLSPSKSKWMIFSKTRADPAPPNAALFINKQPIPRVLSVRFLGVVLDPTLRGEAHTKYLVRKGKAVSDVLASLAGTSWGAHPDTLISIYRAVLRGAIEVSIPINIILAEAKEVPLKIRFTYLIDKYLYKAYSNKFSIVARSLRSIDNSAHSDVIREKARKSLPVYDRYCATKHVLDRVHRYTFLPAYDDIYQLSIYKKDIDFSLTDIQRDTPPHIARAKFQEHFEELSIEATSFYTDGSKSDYSPAGASIYSPSINFIITHKLPSSVSIFTAEAWAILHAITAIIDLNIIEANVFTDSRSVLMALASSDHKQGNYLIHQIKKKLIAAEREGRKIVLCLVPAHKGIPCNEKADRLAKWATSRGAKPTFQVPFTDFQVEAKLHRVNAYKHYLEETSFVKGTQYSDKLYLSDSQKTWFFNKGLNREEIVCISRIRSNHYNLNYSLFRKNIVDSPECPCGEIP
ncbi:PREDICTED: uncharacterized protein LOC105451319 [Wasmannia auropunctata]|uniref:uncharacterized protein LOC105451319 n=1 Tax=Wasmannia auropunctata TaxID=64793 RepID=UPI0005EE9ABB|nr:PREDICTED: uncharacterized protein LOC105451319 [Wasmannia auropunctata]